MAFAYKTSVEIKVSGYSRLANAAALAALKGSYATGVLYTYPGAVSGEGVFYAESKDTLKTVFNNAVES